MKEFIDDLEDYIKKKQHFDLLKNEICCGNCFQNSDLYNYEKKLVEKIRQGNYKNTKERGDILEDLLKSIFQRISLVNSLSVTNRDTSLGQIDLILTPLDNTLFDIWGLVADYPEGIIGECKNYQDSVGREEIEKFCWRVSKGQQLGFFVATKYTKGACDEIGWINKCKQLILVKNSGVYIVPITLEMVECVISQNMNFCYFIEWSIKLSKNMAITNYLKKN